MVPDCGHPAGGLSAGEEHGQAEVEDLRLPVGGQHDVARLQVPMEDAVPVGVLERVGDRRAELEHGVERQRARREPRLERAAGHVLHDQEVVAVLGIEVEHGGDARVGEPGQHPRLAAEALARRRVVERAAQEHLDGDDPVEVGVVRLPHLAHPALADALDEPIPAQQGPGTDRSAFACRSSTCHRRLWKRERARACLGPRQSYRPRERRRNGVPATAPAADSLCRLPA